MSGKNKPNRVLPIVRTLEQVYNGIVGKGSSPQGGIGVVKGIVKGIKPATRDAR